MINFLKALIYGKRLSRENRSWKEEINKLHNLVLDNQANFGIDFVIPINISKSKLEDEFYTSVFIERSEWAPGIWAGTEGANVIIEAEVIKVDMEKRELLVKAETVEYAGRDSEREDKNTTLSKEI